MRGTQVTRLKSEGSLRCLKVTAEAGLYCSFSETTGGRSARTKSPLTLQEGHLPAGGRSQAGQRGCRRGQTGSHAGSEAGGLTQLGSDTGGLTRRWAHTQYSSGF